MHAPLQIGTASWTDPTLIACGRFYPPDATTPEARLRHYATQFNLVEVSASYYALPTAEQATMWVARTPPAFTFNVKAFRLFTGHHTAPDSFDADIRQALPATGKAHWYYRDVPAELREELWRRFRHAVQPLQASGKLGALHFQFAPWVLRNRAGHAHVAECVAQCAGLPVAVEFRNATWFDRAHVASTLAFERALGVAHVVVDSPQGFDHSVPMVWDATTPALAVLRLHGRNAERWNAGGLGASSGRFQYEYSDAELDAMLPEILHLASQVRRMQVVFNTNYEDQGQVAAQRLQSLLRRGR